MPKWARNRIVASSATAAVARNLRKGHVIVLESTTYPGTPREVLQRQIEQADILVVAVGRPGIVPGEWVKPGAVVIDVGINRIAGADGKSITVGDVAFDEVREVAGWISPVPGGVGPMTVAMLLRNTVDAALR